MPTNVLVMSTDQDIIDTPLRDSWDKPINRFSWDQVSKGKLGLDPAVRIVVIAHGSGKEIGNKDAGVVDIDAGRFLDLIAANMKSADPQQIFISTCGTDVAEYAANVRMLADKKNMWSDTKIFGHSDPKGGAVHSPNPTEWVEIFRGRARNVADSAAAGN